MGLIEGSNHQYVKFFGTKLKIDDAVVFEIILICYRGGIEPVISVLKVCDSGSRRRVGFIRSTE